MEVILEILETAYYNDNLKHDARIRAKPGKEWFEGQYENRDAHLEEEDVHLGKPSSAQPSSTYPHISTISTFAHLIRLFKVILALANKPTQP